MKALPYIFFTLIFTSFFSEANAQNLIPNPGFEEPCQSGTLGNGFFGAPGWYNANAGTFDFYTTGATDAACGMSAANPGIWSSYGEFQLPYEGQNMTGGIMFSEPFCIRETLQCKLLAPLEADRIYCFSMRVCMSSLYDFACNGVGMGLSNDSITDFSGSCLIDVAQLVQLQNGQILSDTMNWFLLTGSFVATGGESYLTIGNLRTDNELSVLPFNGGTNLPYSYYYFDDLRLEQCAANTIANVASEVISIFPNPSTDHFTIGGISTSDAWQVFDLTGQLIKKGNGPDVITADMASGVYILVGNNWELRFVK